MRAVNWGERNALFVERVSAANGDICDVDARIGLLTSNRADRCANPSASASRRTGERSARSWDGWSERRRPKTSSIAFADGSWFRFPQTRWSFSQRPRADADDASSIAAAGHRRVFSRNERTDIDAVTFTPIGRTDVDDVEHSLSANYTDGILILHRGHVVYERYFGALAPDRQHLAISVTKSFVATVAAMLIAEKKLDEHATVAHYLPELLTSGVGDATIRQLLDMTTGLDYTEVYTDPKSPLVGPHPGRRLAATPARLRRTQLVLRLSANAAQGAAARRAVRLQDREYRHARSRASARDGPNAERSRERAHLLAARRRARRLFHRGSHRRRVRRRRFEPHTPRSRALR